MSKDERLVKIGWIVCSVQWIEKEKLCVITSIDGVFDNEDAARSLAKATDTKDRPVGLGAVELNIVLPDEKVWPGFYYPAREDGPGLLTPLNWKANE